MFPSCQRQQPTVPISVDSWSGWSNWWSSGASTVPESFPCLTNLRPPLDISNSQLLSKSPGSLESSNATVLNLCWVLSSRGLFFSRVQPTCSGEVFLAMNFLICFQKKKRKEKKTRLQKPNLTWLSSLLATHHSSLIRASPARFRITGPVMCQLVWSCQTRTTTTTTWNQHTLEPAHFLPEPDTYFQRFSLRTGQTVSAAVRRRTDVVVRFVQFVQRLAEHGLTRTYIIAIVREAGSCSCREGGGSCSCLTSHKYVSLLASGSSWAINVPIQYNHMCLIQHMPEYPTLL